MGVTSARPAARARPAAATHRGVGARTAGRAPSRPAGPLAVLGLQRLAGNAAVVGLLQGPSSPDPAVQREEAGWEDAKKAGGKWNAGKTEQSEIFRYPLQLAGVGMKGKWLTGESAHLTTESAAHRAIALVPAHISEADKVTVLLHFHGYAEQAGRPYAGWREHTEDKDHPERSGTVRDVAQDQIEQQMHAAGDNQIVGVLPVGGEQSQFSSDDDAYNTFSGADYLKEVFDTLVKVGGLKKKVDIGGVVLSAHSGGGFTVSSMLAGENAARDGGKAKGHSTPGARIAEVALFEAINNADDYKKVSAWVLGQMDSLADVLAGDRPAKDKHSAIEKAPRFRAYYGSSYVSNHVKLNKAIHEWYDQAFTGSEKAGQGQKNGEVLGSFLPDFTALFQVVHVGGVVHEEIVRGHAMSDKGASEAGSLTDALMALHHPSATPIPELASVTKPAATKGAKAKHGGHHEGTGDKPVSKPPKTESKVTTATPSTTTGDPAITFGSKARQDAVASSSLEILKDVLRAAGLHKAEISSTARTPTDQARAMYQNLVGVGVKAQRKLYGPYGRKVIDVFVDLEGSGHSPKEIQDGMRDKIVELGPSRVSRHCGDFHVLNVFDVAPASLGGAKAKAAFNAAAEAEEGKRISKYIPYPKDPGDHFEIKPSGGVDSASGGGSGGSGGSGGAPAHHEETPHPETKPADHQAAEKDSSTATSTPSSTSKATKPTKATKTETPAGGEHWKASDATADYAVTDEEKTFIESQTPAERAADKAKLKANGQRMKDLRKRAKAGPLPDADSAELSELVALEAKVKKATFVLEKDDVQEVLSAAGFTVQGWYSDIVKTTFLGIGFRVHKLLAERFDTAQSALLGDAKVNPKALDAAALGSQLGMYPSTSDLRAPAPAVGGTKLSLHTFGLAVDLNYKGNPFVGNTKGGEAAAVIKRATSLVSDSPVNVTGTGLGTKEAFEVLKGASDALVTYFSYRAKENRGALQDKLKGRVAHKGEPADEAGWLQQIEADYTALAGRGDFANHKDPAQGFLDFQESVVLALGAAGLTWGGTYNGAKDMMHFDLRNSGDAAKVDKRRKEDTPDT